MLFLSIFTRIFTLRPFSTALEIPFTVEFKDNLYRLESPDGGETFSILKNGEAVEESCKSVAAAFALLQKHLLVDLSFIEELNEASRSLDQIDQDFIEAVASFLFNSPVVSPEAQKHLTAFVELVSNQIFEPQSAGKV